MSSKHVFFIPFYIIFSSLFLLVTSCRQESMDDKLAHDVAEYNRRYCPTPPINYIRTDSITFSRTTHTLTYHCSFCDMLDNEEIVQLNKEKITNILQSTIKESTSMRPFIESGYRFHYVCRSSANSDIILFETGIK